MVLDARHAHSLRYWACHPTAKPQSIDSYELLIKNEINPRIGGEKLTRLSKLHLKRLYSEMKLAGKSQRWQQMVHAVMRKALGDAVEDDVLPFNTAASRKLRPKSTRPETAFLTPEQLEIFLDAAKPDRLFAMYSLAVYSGLRQGELWALGWEDIELDNARLFVRRTLIERKGKLSFGEPKSAAGRRCVSLSGTVVRDLWEHKARMLAEGNSASETVFCSLTGELLRNSNVYRRSLKPIIHGFNDRRGRPQQSQGQGPRCCRTSGSTIFATRTQRRC